MWKLIFKSTIFKLLLAVAIGIVAGFFVNEGFMNVVVTVKYILGQLIFFMVPFDYSRFYIFFDCPHEGKRFPYVGQCIGVGLFFFCRSCFFCLVLGYWLIPLLSVEPATEGLKEIPPLVFRLDIPPCYERYECFGTFDYDRFGYGVDKIGSFRQYTR